MPTVRMPRELSLDSLNDPYHRILTSVRTQGRRVELDFSRLRWAEPGGITGLACILSGLTTQGVEFSFVGTEADSDAIRYLDDAGFFRVLSKSPINQNAAPRSTTIPFTQILDSSHTHYLHTKLAPWIQTEVRLSPDTIAGLTTNIAEALQNVEHHGGKCGFAMAQHYPKKNTLCIAVADIGKGIPDHVRTVHSRLNDAEALVKACERGFTTKTNYTNRGFGLDNLIRYAVHNNGGTVTLRSLHGKLLARPGDERPDLLSMQTEWGYPGTCVHIVLRTDTLERSDDIVSPEVFTW